MTKPARKPNKLLAENARLREALDRIARPVWWMQEDQKRKTGSINGISGAGALALANDPVFLRDIAEKALAIKPYLRPSDHADRMRHRANGHDD